MDLPKQCFYKKNTWYAITINPQDQHQYFGKEQRFNAFKNFWNTQFLTFPSMKIDYHFNIELSEPQKLMHNSGGPRLHMHGIIRFNTNHSIFKFLLNVLGELNKYGIIDIDTISDMKYWLAYITKQEHIFKCSKPILTNNDTIITTLLAL